MIPSERDMVVRTIIGEAGGEPPVGQQAVASVILNRVKNGGYGGSDPISVVLAPNQFEAWSNPGKMLSYDPSSPEYQNASKALDAAEAGSDPTQGALNFLNPDLQRSLGRPQPVWATPTGGQRIGNHVFYGGGQTAMAQPVSNSQTLTPAEMALDLSHQSAPSVSAPAAGTVDPFTKTFGANVEQGAAPADAVDPFTKVFGENAGAATAQPAPAAVTQTPMAKALSPYNAFTYSMLGGIPVVGPYLQRAANAASVAGLRLSGVDADTAQKQVNALTQQAQTEHPVMAGAGNVAGQIGGYTAATMGAPAAFGISEAPLAVRSLISAGTNALLGGADAASRDKDFTTGAVTGGVGGLVAPGIGDVAGNLISSKIAPEVARLADLAMNKFGIPLSADQLASTPMVRFAGSVVNRFPFTGGAAMQGSQRTAFNRAIAGLMGEQADSLTPGTMSSIKTRLGQVFETAAKNTQQIGADTEVGQGLMNVYNEAPQVLTDQEWQPVKRQLQNIVQKFKDGGGSITGDQYLALTRTNTPLDRATQSDNPNIAYYARQLEDVLNGALERHAAPEDVAALQQARSQWRIMRTVQPLAAKAPTGEISPALLMSRVMANNPNMAYRTNDDLADLARIGQLFLKEPSSSGTGERSWVMDRLGDIGKLIASVGPAAAAAKIGMSPVEVGAALGAPTAAGLGVGSILRSQPLVRSLVRGAMSPVPQTARTATNALAQSAGQLGARAGRSIYFPQAVQPAQQ